MVELEKTLEENKDDVDVLRLAKKYGIKKVPTTMEELKQVSETIYKKSNHKVVGAGFDSLSNYYTLGMKDEGVNFSDKVNKGSTILV